MSKPSVILASDVTPSPHKVHGYYNPIKMGIRESFKSFCILDFFDPFFVYKSLSLCCILSIISGPMHRGGILQGGLEIKREDKIRKKSIFSLSSHDQYN